MGRPRPPRRRTRRAKASPSPTGSRRDSLQAPRKLSRFPESNRIFLRRRQVLRARRDRSSSPTSAARSSASPKLGAKDFYEGETARLLAKDMAAHGGLITLDDLKATKPSSAKPLTGNTTATTIITAPPPSSGGVGVLQMLGMLEGTGYEKAGAGSASTSTT